MRNNKFIIGLAALTASICVMFSGCGKPDPQRTGDKPSKIPTEPSQSHFVITETPAKKPEHPPITFEEGEVTLEIENISITANKRINSGASKKMNKEIDESENRIINAYNDGCFVLKQDLDNGVTDASSFPRQTYVNYSYTRNDGKAITITQKIEDYSAGNLTSTVTFCYNFEPFTGELIKNPFYDINDPDGLDVADDVMYKKLKEKYGDIISYENLAFPSFVDAADDFWQFTDTGIKVVFPEDYIAPLESGELEINYTKEELPEFAQKYFN